ncbi:MAG: mandelate racemase/muconate lactonizing enzyme family protein [Rhodospirillaceae bacterium]|nr:mandelate racemase/muconate lactonizing enzyme family protein [Rhodospirillaceae bacterium]
MKIRDIEIIELRAPGLLPDGFDGSYSDCLVLVHTDDGLTGISETDSVPAVIRAIIDTRQSHRTAMGLREVLIGQDASDIEGLWTRMYDATSYYGRRGAVLHAISAIDMALWDLRGKALGRSVCDLLGTRRRDRVPAYGTIYPTGNTPDEVRRNIDRGLAHGIRGIKICAERFWHQDVPRATELIRTARAHVGDDIRLMVDVTAAWTRAEDGIPLMPVFRDLVFDWVEAPLPADDFAGHARLQGFGVPIAGGDLGLTTRHEFASLFEIGKVDIAQPDISMVGGLSEMMHVAALARTHRGRVVPHGYKTNILLAANLAFLGQQDEEEPLEFSMSESPLRWDLTKEKLPILSDGTVAIPDAPGLGVSLNPETVARFRVG